MIREIGYCSGVENYSRYFDRRKPGSRPFCLIDYFPDDFLMFIDESHVSIPQVRAMWGGDRSRKANLVDYGFRLPSALDNRPLTFAEFEGLIGQTIYVSATPSDYELLASDGVVVEQLIRPTGLLDPVIEVRPTQHQVDDLMEEISKRIQMGDRVLVTTITKRMAEELSKYLSQMGVKIKYIHSEVATLDRVEILRELRLGIFDVLVGVNLLREGLDLPEVSLVVIMDADKEGFLRNERSLIQTIGRAARNDHGLVIMYGDKMTGSMQGAINETARRRIIQKAFNDKHNITPQTILKDREAIMSQTSAADSKKEPKSYQNDIVSPLAADPVVAYMDLNQLKKFSLETRKKMEKAAQDLDFVEAARLRDEMLEIDRMVKEEKV
jgi:excinuclease ABC subunit B